MTHHQRIVFRAVAIVALTVMVGICLIIGVVWLDIRETDSAAKSAFLLANRAHLRHCDHLEGIADKTTFDLNCEYRGGTVDLATFANNSERDSWIRSGKITSVAYGNGWAAESDSATAVRAIARSLGGSVR